jgi:hypothetical protein
MAEQEMQRFEIGRGEHGEVSDPGPMCLTCHGTGKSALGDVCCACCGSGHFMETGPTRTPWTPV